MAFSLSLLVRKDLLCMPAPRVLCTYCLKAAAGTSWWHPDDTLWQDRLTSGNQSPPSNLCLVPLSHNYTFPYAPIFSFRQHRLCCRVSKILYIKILFLLIFLKPNIFGWNSIYFGVRNLTNDRSLIAALVVLYLYPSSIYKCRHINQQPIWGKCSIWQIEVGGRSDISDLDFVEWSAEAIYIGHGQLGIWHGWRVTTNLNKKYPRQGW